MPSRPPNLTENQKLTSQDVEAEDLPEAFKYITKPSKLPIETFEMYQKHLDGEGKSKCAATKNAIGDIKIRAKNLLEVCRKTIPENGADISRQQSYQTYGRGRRVLKDVAKVPFTAVEEINELKDALEEVKKIKPLLPSDEGNGQHNYHNIGVCAINIHHGNGN
ncbi:hypothetical protein QBC36DRAFT_316515 [Triangularia setosa]|uniref:Uncharacterized protein n=1 Tax=Triangularia setosa TaxID=2587417 RepID=A0AAN6VVT3_9PEZI|nr:hypothetical protein QBC36DRAFT_316515 [Podospora setosa]